MSDYDDGARLGCLVGFLFTLFAAGVTWWVMRVLGG